MLIEYDNLWKSALAELEITLSKANFSTWIKDTNIGGQENGIVFLNVPSTFIKEWLENKYHKHIVNAIRNLLPETRDVQYVISSSNQTKKQSKAGEAMATARIESKNEEQLAFKDLYIDKEFNLNPKYTFESFVVAPFNEIAHAAATAITKNLGSMYNPLFIYGGPGLGKTHLLQAIGNKAKQENNNLKIHYLTSERFANEYISSIENKNINAFKEKYRKYNLLIIDDIQFFSGKMKIQEEFFHVFNSLYEGNNQIVFSSDKPPKHITGLEERLRSRFEGGMMVDISPPEFESRLAILKIKAEQKGVLFDQEVLEYIATSIKDNIRELEGGLSSLAGQTKLKGRVLSLNEVKEHLKKNTEPSKNITITQVIKAVAEYYSIEEKNLFEKTRKKEIVKPRQVAMYLLREDLNTSYPSIGSKFGQRDHTTVIHAFKKIDLEIKNKERTEQEIIAIREILYKNSG